MERGTKSEVRKCKKCEKEHVDGRPRRWGGGKNPESCRGTNLCSDPSVKDERARLAERDGGEDERGLTGEPSATEGGQKTTR